MAKWLTLLMLLALAAGAQAQINHSYNEVGIYTVPDPEGCETAQIDVAPATAFTGYLVLTNPYNETLGRPVTTVGGFELRLETAADVYILDAAWGPCPQPWEPWPDLLIGCALPVQDGRVQLLAITFMSLSGNPSFLYLTPVRDAPQSIPGRLAFTDYDDAYSVHAMDPVSGSADVPVFAINWDGDLSFCRTVPGEGMSFGALKALYR